MATAESHMEGPQHPHHRKIDLQSPLDLEYLRGNLEKSAQQKLDLHFPILPAQTSAAAQDSSSQKSYPAPAEDPMRAAVSRLVDSFIAETFDSATHSISINGLDAISPVFASALDPSRTTQPEENIEYEAYDPRLTSKLSSLYADLENLTTQVAKLRRDAPSTSAQNYSDQLANVMVTDDKTAQSTAESSVQNVESGLELKHMSEEWQQDIEAMYRHGVDGLASLTGNAGNTALSAGQQSTKTSLTGTVGLVERAGVVARELE